MGSWSELRFAFPHHARFCCATFNSVQIDRMVKLSLLGALASLSIGLANGQQSWLPGGLVKGALTRFGINSTILNAALGTEHERPPAPHVVDLTDSNWETVLRTGGEDPFGKSLADDTTWVSPISLFLR